MLYPNGFRFRMMFCCSTQRHRVVSKRGGGGRQWYIFSGRDALSVLSTPERVFSCVSSPPSLRQESVEAFLVVSGLEQGGWLLLLLFFGCLAFCRALQGELWVFRCSIEHGASGRALLSSLFYLLVVDGLSFFQ